METRGLPEPRPPLSAAHQGGEDEEGGNREKGREGGRAAGGGGVDPDLSQELEATAPFHSRVGGDSEGRGLPGAAGFPGLSTHSF